MQKALRLCRKDRGINTPLIRIALFPEWLFQIRLPHWSLISFLLSQQPDDYSAPFKTTQKSMYKPIRLNVYIVNPPQMVSMIVLSYIEALCIMCVFLLTWLCALSSWFSLWHWRRACLSASSACARWAFSRHFCEYCSDSTSISRWKDSSSSLPNTHGSCQSSLLFHSALSSCTKLKTQIMPIKKRFVSRSWPMLLNKKKKGTWMKSLVIPVLAGSPPS